MNPTTRQYLFGAIFFAVGVYQIVMKDYVEAALYCLAGLAFIFNTLATDLKLLRYKKPLVITTWALIIITGILFLYLIQSRYL